MVGIPGWMQLLLVVILVVMLFGRGKISELMGDVAKGIRSFRDGLKGEEEATPPPDEITTDASIHEEQSTRDETRTP